MAHSVVKNKVEIDTAFWNETFNDLAGSITPNFIKFPYLPLLALYP